MLSPHALSPRAPSVHQLLRQLSAAPASKGDGAAAAVAVVVQPALGSDLFEGQLQGRTMASMYVWLAVSLIYYGLSLSAGHMGGGGSLHVNFALSMGVEVPGAAATVLMTACTYFVAYPAAATCLSSPTRLQPDTPATRRVHARPQPFTHTPANPTSSRTHARSLPVGPPLLGKLLSGFLLDRIGRRATLLCGLLVGACACLACAVLPPSLALRCALVGQCSPARRWG